jgi:hypothetical protein
MIAGGNEGRRQLVATDRQGRRKALAGSDASLACSVLSPGAVIEI